MIETVQLFGCWRQWAGQVWSLRSSLRSLRSSLSNSRWEVLRTYYILYIINASFWSSLIVLVPLIFYVWFVNYIKKKKNYTEDWLILVLSWQHARDLQTEADRAAQRCIISSLSKCFPKMTIIGKFLMTFTRVNIKQ